MKKRTLAYFRKNKARRILQNPIAADLTSFLSATFELCRNRIVKNHIKHSLHSLQNFGNYQMSA